MIAIRRIFGTRTRYARQGLVATRRVRNNVTVSLMTLHITRIGKNNTLRTRAPQIQYPTGMNYHF